MLFATVLLMVAGLSYLGLALAFLLGTQRRVPRATAQQPMVSVLVAARNEERTIRACLESLVGQTYPQQRFEIIVMDDHSEDRTAEIAAELSGRFGNVRVIPVQESSSGLSGKQNAIAQGAEDAQGQILLVTDADCVAPPGWVKGMVEYFDERTGLVGAFTLFDRKDASDSLFAKLQELDLLYLLTVAAGAAGIGSPTSLIGNNLGVRRLAYQQVGGYAQIGHSVTEDMALLNAIRRHGQWRIRFAPDTRLTVATLPAASWKEFYRQRKRWALGGLEISLLGAFALSSVLLMRLVILLLVALSPWNPTYLLMAVLGVLLTALSDFWLALRGCFLQLRFDLIRYFPLLVPFQFAYNLALAIPILLGRTRIAWKDRPCEARSV